MPMLIDYSKIPSRTMEGLERYLAHGIDPGGFIEAVLSNDLKEAFGRADEENREALFQIVAYLYNEAPSNCWGSPECVRQFITMKRREK